MESIENLSRDSSRKKMDVVFYCTKHPNQELAFNHQSSQIGASSAYEINFKISIYPCEECQREINRIKGAIDILLKS